MLQLADSARFLHAGRNLLVAVSCRVPVFQRQSKAEREREKARERARQRDRVREGNLLAKLLHS